jgi:hypothetical protein
MPPKTPQSSSSDARSRPKRALFSGQDPNADTAHRGPCDASCRQRHGAGVCGVLGVQEPTVRKWIDAGALPAYRFPPVTGDWRSRSPTRSRSSNKPGFRSSSRTTIRANRIAAGPDRLSFAATRFASSSAAFRTLAGIGRTPDVVATSAGVFKLDVQSANNAFATHKTDNAATDATGIRHGGERDRSRHRLSESDACANRADSQMRCGEVARGAPFSQGRARTRTQRIAYLVRSSAHFR